jgi:hypothetical protein
MNPRDLRRRYQEDAQFKAKAELFDELVEAVRLFVAYDAADETSIELMMNYNTAIEASKAALTKAEQLAKTI